MVEVEVVEVDGDIVELWVFNMNYYIPFDQHNYNW